MKKNRQDAWTQDEDLLLAEVVLRHIREGSTQLTAFEEVGEALSRTSAACGFRWNSLVRKKYETAINLAKKQRKKVNTSEVSPTLEDEIITSKTQMDEEIASHDLKKVISIDDMVEYLQSLKDNQNIQHALEEENKKLEQTVIELTEKSELAEKKYQELQKDYQLMNEDYKALIGIMERARKMVIMQDEHESNMKFQMDYNGNLEKVNKK